MEGVNYTFPFLKMGLSRSGREGEASLTVFKIIVRDGIIFNFFFYTLRTRSLDAGVGNGGDQGGHIGHTADQESKRRRFRGPKEGGGDGRSGWNLLFS